jgi:hypothetical protein
MGTANSTEKIPDPRWLLVLAVSITVALLLIFN